MRLRRAFWRFPWQKLIRRPRHLALLTLTVLLLWWLVDALCWGIASLHFDPERQLTPVEATAVAAAHRLPEKRDLEKRVHFMYRGYALDDELKSYLTSWRTVYPDYQIYFWTDRDINELVAQRYPAWRELYHNRLSNYLERSDAARAFVLHLMGGWYADLDAGCLRRADSVAAAHALILPLEPYVHAFDNFNKRRLVSNAIMYSVRRHSFWMYYLERLNASLVGRARRESTLEAVFVTGPVFLTEVAFRYIQAHSGAGCPSGLMCPYLPKPVEFLPTYDDHTVRMRRRLRLYCAFLFGHPDFLADCQRYHGKNYENSPDPKQSYAFHSFKHLNERLGAARSESDVRGWGLELTVGNAIFADLARQL